MSADNTKPAVSGCQKTDADREVWTDNNPGINAPSQTAEPLMETEGYVQETEPPQVERNSGS